MPDFPSDEAKRAAVAEHRRGVPYNTFDAMVESAVQVAFAVDEPKIRFEAENEVYKGAYEDGRADERRRIVAELRAEHDRRNGLESSYENVADYIERMDEPDG